LLHKAEPQMESASHSTCLHCEKPIKKVPGGHGSTWVHEDTGFVAESGKARSQPETKWWEDHDNIVLLVRYLADGWWPRNEIADAVEKPWKWQTEFDDAVINRDRLAKEEAT